MDTLHGRFQMPFILDTGAAISLIPAPVASRRGIVFPAELADLHESPRTMQGRLSGHLGEIVTTFLDRSLRIPCFFYLPQAEPLAGNLRRPGARNVDEWIDEVAGEGRDLAHPWVLGRLGFMNRFHVLVEPLQTTICSDGFRPPPPRRRWWWFWA